MDEWKRRKVSMFSVHLRLPLIPCVLSVHHQKVKEFEFVRFCSNLKTVSRAEFSAVRVHLVACEFFNALILIFRVTWFFFLSCQGSFIARLTPISAVNCTHDLSAELEREKWACVAYLLFWKMEVARKNKSLYKKESTKCKRRRIAAHGKQKNVSVMITD